jgi:hypothetical protein
MLTNNSYAYASLVLLLLLSILPLLRSWSLQESLSFAHLILACCRSIDQDRDPKNVYCAQFSIVFILFHNY